MSSGTVGLGYGRKHDPVPHWDNGNKRNVRRQVAGGGDVKQWRIPNTNGVPKWRQTMPSTMAAPSFTGGLDTVWMMAISGSPDNSDDWRNPSSAIVSNGVQAGLISGSGVYLVLERSYLSVVQLSVGLPCRNSQIDGKRPILAYSGLD